MNYYRSYRGIDCDSWFALELETIAVILEFKYDDVNIAGRLVCTWRINLPKVACILHYRNLKLNILNGLILKKIHMILKFQQSLWLKEYIDLNTQYSTNVKIDFEKKQLISKDRINNRRKYWEVSLVVA